MLVHYQGTLGEFDYDDKIFYLHKSDVGSDYLSCICEDNDIDINTIKIPEGIVSCYYMFYKCKNLIKAPHIPDSVLDTTSMFRNCSKLQTLSNFPNKLKFANEMCRGCVSLNTIPSKFPDTLVEANGMFYNCVSLQEIPRYLPKFLKTAMCMFYNTNIDIVPYMYNNVINANLMYYKCNKISRVENISDNLQSTQGMFNNCCNLEVFVAEFPSQLLNATEMFFNCYSLRVIPTAFPNKLTTCYRMFFDCYNLRQAPRLLPKSVIDVREMFYNCYRLQTHIVPFRKRPNLKYKDMYVKCYSLREPYDVKERHKRGKKIASSIYDMFITTGLNNHENTAITVLENNHKLEIEFARYYTDGNGRGEKLYD